LLEQLDREKPGNTAVLMLLADLYELQGDWPALERVLGQLERVAPDAERVKLTKVRMLAAQGPLEEAGRLFRGVTLDPSDPDVLRTRVVLAVRGGDLQVEAEVARTLFERGPSTATAIYLAGVHIRSGQPEQAIPLLEQWVGTHPDDLAVQLVLAGLHAEAGRGEEAVALYRRVLDREPRNVIALNGLAWQLRKTAPKEAQELAERAYAHAPESPEVGDTLAMVLLEQGAYQQALDVNEKVTRLAPKDTRFQLHRVEILGRRGERKAAAALLEELMAKPLDPAQRKEAESLRTTLGQ
jgi:tetratricopeptide (TPR) repeat protein